MRLRSISLAAFAITLAASALGAGTVVEAATRCEALQAQGYRIGCPKPKPQPSSGLSCEEKQKLGYRIFCHKPQPTPTNCGINGRWDGSKCVVNKPKPLPTNCGINGEWTENGCIVRKQRS